MKTSQIIFVFYLLFSKTIAQDTTRILYEGISPDESSPHKSETLGHIGLKNPERGFSIRGGVIDFYSKIDYPNQSYFENITGEFPTECTPLEEYYSTYEDDGISLVEIETYINYTDNLTPVSSNTSLLDLSELSTASIALNETLNELGVKSHLILNSSFSFEQTATDGVLNSLSVNGNRYNKNLAYLAASQPFFSEIAPRTALVHLGWISTPWDYNHYRLSSHWKRSNYSIGTNYPVGRINRTYEQPNHHHTFRESTQRSSWGQAHDQASVWNSLSAINHLRKDILQSTLNLFPHQKVLLKSTTAPDEANAKQDLVAFYGEIADTYFRIINEELKKVAPNQNYLGCRFAWANNDIVLSTAGKYLDIMSFNKYEYSIENFKLPKGVDKPVMIGEFHFGALDKGSFHIGIKKAKDQAERGQMYQDYIQGALRHPNIVGAHWFQYIDEPNTGRFDGENYNVGFVDITDNPFEDLINKVKETTYSMYDYRINNSSKQ